MAVLGRPDAPRRSEPGVRKA